MELKWNKLNYFMSYMWIYSLFEIFYDRILPRLSKEVMYMSIPILIVILAVSIVSTNMLQGTFPMFLYLQYFEITGSINRFNLMVICQIVLIKKFRLTINIIKRIFLRIKS